MATPESSAQLVARFLRANHYDETLEVFLREAGLPEDTGSLTLGAWSIEQILQEKTQFDESVKFERKGDSGNQRWTLPAPSISYEPQLDISSNVLCVSGDLKNNNISVTTADRSWKLFSTQSPYTVNSNEANLGDSPILSTIFTPDGHVLTTSMSGHLTLRRASTLALIDECRHHSKYAVQVVSYLQNTDWFIATAAWDQKIYIYAPQVLGQDHAEVESGDSVSASLPGHLGEPVHTIALLSNPESLVFVNHPDSNEVYLVVSRRDSTHLSYYQIVRETSGVVLVHEAGRQNLAPHANAWVSFTPCSLALCPTDPSLIAVATSHLPHMKVIVVRLLFPRGNNHQPFTATEHLTQASMARADIALQDREDAAIRLQVTTMAPQTPYSTPQVVWRPDGSGLFVNGDDGVIRGVEATTGKVVSLLKGHEMGSKVRTLWAGLINADSQGQRQEVLVSGGFDKKLLIWSGKSNE